MIKRPKPGEDEEDLLKMQEEYLQEKNKDPNLKPSAAVTNLRQNEPIKRSSTSLTGTRAPSKYAQSKSLKSSTEKRPRTDATTNSVMGDILEKNNAETANETKPEDEDDKVYFPVEKQSVLGRIVEKNVDSPVDIDIQPMPTQGFPEVMKRDPNIVAGQKSIHRQHLEKMGKNLQSVSKMDIDESSECSVDQNFSSAILNLPSKSFIISSKEADEIHSENIKTLSKLSEQEILEEQQKLLLDLNPKIVEFIKTKRQSEEDQSIEMSFPPSLAKIWDDAPGAKKTKSASNTEPAQPVTHVSSSLYCDYRWENDILSHPEASKWINFNSLETDKLQWTKCIEENKKLKPDEPFEARFDFKGYLLPYTIEYTEETKTLFHHGDEPHRPGYTITELIELSRSAVIQQRAMALSTLAGILEYNSVGTYKNIIELPLSKIFFLIRIALDENKVTIMDPALRAMRNLFYNRIDEISLDALLGHEEGMVQPYLQNDKSEIEELESKESELKDFHLAEIDLISALLRTNILERIYYILETIRPPFNCVQYCLHILIRLARDSLETASRIVQTTHLMESIINHFIPKRNVDFPFTSGIVYNKKPILSAVKLLRILSLQSYEISTMLVEKYNILSPISEYINSRAERAYGTKIQVEAYALLSNLLVYTPCIDISIFPAVIKMLHSHVQSTEMLLTKPIVIANHAAMVLQLINRLMFYKLAEADNYKRHIYPLLEVGIQKWMHQLAESKDYTAAHVRLLCSAIDCCKTVFIKTTAPSMYLNDPLKRLSSSEGFKALIENLVPSSNLLSGLENKDHNPVKNLTSLGASVIDSGQKVLPILNVRTPIPCLRSLFSILLYLKDNTAAEGFLQHLTPYLKKLAKTQPNLAENWFTRMEIDLVFDILKLSIRTKSAKVDKDVLYAVGYKLCYALRKGKTPELIWLMENIIFNKNVFTPERLLNLMSIAHPDGLTNALAIIQDIKKCYSRVVNQNYVETSQNIVLLEWQEPMLPRDWIYLPILSLYSINQELETRPQGAGEHVMKVAASIIAEKQTIITCSLEWILFNELCFADLLNDIDETDRFCRIMCVFLCDQSLFLDARIKFLLENISRKLFQSRYIFDFDRQLVGLHNFQDFYTQLLEQFQSVSYGDATFSACLLVPLAQQHNVKWRKLLWSEYAGCLRALDCPKDKLCYTFDAYLYPEETDETLIKSYFQALSGNLLRSGTIVHEIAQHHVKCFKKRKSMGNVNA